MEFTKHLKTCEKGHRFYKTSDCPVCPICETERKLESGFLSIISAPARRALEGEGIDTLEKLSTHSEKEILSLHGIGPSSIPKLENELKTRGLAFKKYPKRNNYENNKRKNHSIFMV